VRGRLEDLHGVAEQEPVAVPATGDPHPDPLPRQGVTDKDHPAVVPGDAVTAVRDLADLGLELRADQ
jgi:hypothetical protein